MSLTVDDLKVKSTYNFGVYPAALLGDSFQGCTVLSVMVAEDARRIEDIDGMHAKVYPYLPAGTPNDPDAYNYLKLKTSSGAVTVIGLAWINEATIELVEHVTISVAVRNALTSDATKIRDALIQNGFNDITVTVL